jgi:hypothetical protein
MAAVVLEQQQPHLNTRKLAVLRSWPKPLLQVPTFAALDNTLVPSGVKLAMGYNNDRIKSYIITGINTEECMTAHFSTT